MPAPLQGRRLIWIPSHFVTGKKKAGFTGFIEIYR